MVIFSEQKEIERVQGIYKKIDWYRANGYDIDVPKKDIHKELSDNKRKYQETSEKLNRLSIDTASVDKIFKPIKYDVFLTMYGTKGSYVPPGGIIVNIRNRTIKDITDTIIHEYIHLQIHKYIKKYNITHWDKERIVDLIVNKYFKINRWQNIKKYKTDIDKLFNKYFEESLSTFFRKIQ